jgi:hypothetical protein
MTPAMILRLITVLALALGASLAAAADDAYPPGSRIRLTPPPGMVTSKSFFGYEDPDNNATIILLALPAQAYADLDKSVTADALKRQGVTFETREAMPLSTGDAFLVLGHQDVENIKVRKWILVAASSGLTALVTVQIPETAKAVYPDAAIRAALATLAIRTTVPVDEQLGLLPFKVGELAGFHIGGIVPGRAVVLRDAADATGSPDTNTDPLIFVAIAPGGPVQTADRDAFARNVFATAPNLRDIRDHVRALADRRPAGSPDSRRCEGSGGHHHADGRSVVALWRRRIFANDRDRARGRVERRLSPLPLRTRRHRGALTTFLGSSDDRRICQREPRGSREDAP